MVVGVVGEVVVVVGVVGEVVVVVGVVGEVVVVGGGGEGGEGEVVVSRDLSQCVKIVFTLNFNSFECEKIKFKNDFYLLRKVSIEIIKLFFQTSGFSFFEENTPSALQTSLLKCRLLVLILRGDVRSLKEKWWSALGHHRIAIFIQSPHAQG